MIIVKRENGNIIFLNERAYSDIGFCKDRREIRGKLLTSGYTEIMNVESIEYTNNPVSFSYKEERKPIEYSGIRLPTKSLNIIKFFGIKTLKQLSLIRQDALMDLPKIGKTTIMLLDKALRDNGLCWGENFIAAYYAYDCEERKYFFSHLMLTKDKKKRSRHLTMNPIDEKDWEEAEKNNFYLNEIHH